MAQKPGATFVGIIGVFVTRRWALVAHIGLEIVQRLGYDCRCGQ